MAEDSLLTEAGYHRRRDTPYSYRCQGCGRCCYDKAIRVSPYELLRLARGLGSSTTEVLTRFTTEGGTTLAQRADGGCVFLNGTHCGVHRDRPFACRIYPLGWMVDGAEVESFADLRPHPQSEGIYGQDGTVDDHWRAEGCEPYRAAARQYAAIVWRMQALLQAGGGQPADLTDDAAFEPFLDVDRAVSEYCATLGRSVPAEVDAVLALHLEALSAWLDSFTPEKGSR